MENFDRQKKLATSGIDFSRKGSIDEKIFELIVFINDQKHLFTTSSCSGRTILFDDHVEDADKITRKQGCQWLFTSHDIVDKNEMLQVLDKICGDCVFKFEPFVLHVQCRNLEHAQSVLQCAVQSGFRNSGISLGKKGKIVVGVRSTHSMEVPLSSNSQLLVSSEYVEFLIELANKKMKENFRRIERFFDNLKQTLLHLENKPDTAITKKDIDLNKIKDKMSHDKSNGKCPNSQSHDKSEPSCDISDLLCMFDDDIT